MSNFGIVYICGVFFLPSAKQKKNHSCNSFFFVLLLCRARGASVAVFHLRLFFFLHFFAILLLCVCVCVYMWGSFSQLSFNFFFFFLLALCLFYYKSLYTSSVKDFNMQIMTESDFAVVDIRIKKKEKLLHIIAYVLCKLGVGTK